MPARERNARRSEKVDTGAALIGGHNCCREVAARTMRERGIGRKRKKGYGYEGIIKEVNGTDRRESMNHDLQPRYKRAAKKMSAKRLTGCCCRRRARRRTCCHGRTPPEGNGDEGRRSAPNRYQMSPSRPCDRSTTQRVSVALVTLWGSVVIGPNA